MPTYEYETIPENPGEKPVRYEFRQRMSDEPLRVHPETGAKLRRVYSAFAVGGNSSPCGSSECACETGGTPHHHGGGCGCGCCH